MKIATMLSAAITALAITSSAALAQQVFSGVITEINRLDGTIAIRQVQGGTVGANAGAAAAAFKVQAGLALEDLHAGDRVSASYTDAGGTRTITKLQKQ